MSTNYLGIAENKAKIMMDNLTSTTLKLHHKKRILDHLSPVAYSINKCNWLKGRPLLSHFQLGIQAIIKSVTLRGNGHPDVDNIPEPWNL